MDGNHARAAGVVLSFHKTRSTSPTHVFIPKTIGSGLSRICINVRLLVQDLEAARLEYPEPNAASVQSFEEASRLLQSGDGRFADSGEVFEALGVWGCPPGALLTSRTAVHEALSSAVNAWPASVARFRWSVG